MATIANQNNQNDNENNNLNVGSSLSQPGGSGGGIAPVSSTPITNAAKPTSSGQYTNFSNYLQSNQQAGGRLSNLLSGSTQKQSKAVDNTLKNTGGIASAVTAEKDRISQDLDKIRGAVQNTQSGDYSGFNQFLNQPAAQPGAQQNNPVQASLNQNFQDLVLGRTQGEQLGQQSQDIFNRAGQQLKNLQTTQNLAQTEAGRQQLLRNVIGQAGTYTQGANLLDQSLLSGNNARLGALLSNIGTAAKTTGQNFANTQQNIIDQLTGLEVSAEDAMRGVVDLSQQGLGTLDTALAQKMQQEQGLRDTSQADILQQFANQRFNQGTADQLGIGQGASLMNILRDPGIPQNYNVTSAKEFVNNPYLNLAQNDITKANVINEPQLTAYSALQKFLQQDPSAFQYTAAGTVDPAYTLGAERFKQDLGQKYSDFAARAQINPNQHIKDVVLGPTQYAGNAPSGFQQGDALGVGVNIPSLLNTGDMSQMAAAGNFQNLNVNPNALITDMASGRTFQDNFGYYQNALQNYLQRTGLSDTASIVPSDFEGTKNYNIS